MQTKFVVAVYSISNKRKHCYCSAGISSVFIQFYYKYNQLLH